MFKIPNKIRECIKKDQNMPIEYKLIKLMEEVGEFSSLILANKNIKNKSKSAVEQLKNDGQLSILEESIDVLIVIIDIIEKLKNDFNFSDDDIENILSKKIDKWYSKIL